MLYLLRFTLIIILSISFNAHSSESSKVQDEIRKSLIHIEISSVDENGTPYLSKGTGFIVTPDGVAVTALHVLEKATKIEKVIEESIEITANVRRKNGEFYNVESIDKLEGRDIAKIRLIGGGVNEFKPLCLSSLPTIPPIGTKVYSSGFPHKHPFISSIGKVESTSGERGTYLLDFDVDDGQSGSPVYDKDGLIVGLLKGSHKELKKGVVIPIRDFLNFLSVGNPEDCELTPPSTDYKKNTTFPKMIDIEGGVFIMGCEIGRDNIVNLNKDFVKDGCYKKELPAHKVEIPDFQLAETEVTVRQFKEFVESTNYKTSAEGIRPNHENKIYGCWDLNASNKGIDAFVQNNNWKSPGFPQDSDHPVTCISWFDAQNYIDWLNKENGFRKPLYRFPKEAEWEYAARGKDYKNALPWGNSIESCLYGTYKNPSCGWGYQTTPVGSHSINKSYGFSLFDMHGNVAEYVIDAYNDEYSEEFSIDPIQQVDMNGRSDINKVRANRGGSWYTGLYGVRSSFRNGFIPGASYSYVGLRIARDKN